MEPAPAREPEAEEEDQPPLFRRHSSQNMTLMFQEAQAEQDAADSGAAAAARPAAQADADALDAAGGGGCAAVAGPPAVEEHTPTRIRSGTIPARFSPSADGPATIDFTTSSGNNLLGRNPDSSPPGGSDRRSSPVPTPRLRGTLAEGHILPLNLDNHFYIVHKVATGRHIAQSLHMTLKSEGFESWLDVDRGHSGGTGQDGPTASNMEEGIRKSANLLLVLTKDVLESEWCQQELQWGIKEGKGVVCVHDEKCKEDHCDHFDFAKEPQKAPEEFRNLVRESV
jgi:hypothetical protein